MPDGWQWANLDGNGATITITYISDSTDLETSVSGDFFACIVLRNGYTSIMYYNDGTDTGEILNITLSNSNLTLNYFEHASSGLKIVDGALESAYVYSSSVYTFVANYTDVVTYHPLTIYTITGNEYDGVTAKNGVVHYYNSYGNITYNSFSSGAQGKFCAKRSVSGGDEICYVVTATNTTYYYKVACFNIYIYGNTIDGQVAKYSCGGLKSALTENIVCDPEMNVSFSDGDLDETGETSLYAVWNYEDVTLKKIKIQKSPLCGSTNYYFNYAITDGNKLSSGSSTSYQYFYVSENDTKLYYCSTNFYYEIVDLYYVQPGLSGEERSWKFAPDNSDYEGNFIQDSVLNVPAGTWLDEVSYFAPVVTEDQASLTKFYLSDNYTYQYFKLYYTRNDALAYNNISQQTVYSFAGSTDIYVSVSNTLYLVTDIEISREGFTFLGFYTARVGGTKVIEAGEVSLLEPCNFATLTHLYAQWEVPYCKVNLQGFANDQGMRLFLYVYYDSSSTTKLVGLNYYSDAGTSEIFFVESGTSTLLYFDRNVFYEVYEISLENRNSGMSCSSYVDLHGFYTQPNGEGEKVIDGGGPNLMFPWTEEEEVTLYAHLTGAKFEFYVDTQGAEFIVTCEMGTFSSSDMMTLIVEYYSTTIWYPYVTDGGTEYYEVIATSCTAPPGYEYRDLRIGPNSGNSCINSNQNQLNSKFSYTSSVTAYVYLDPIYQGVWFDLKSIRADNYSSYTGGAVLIEQTWDNGYNISTTVSSSSQYINSIQTERECTATITSVPEGYVFWGWSYNDFDSRETAMEAPSESFTFVIKKDVKQFYFYFKEVSDNQLKYDETDKYYYFEDGYFPQSYVGDDANIWLNENVVVDSTALQIGDCELMVANDITYNGTTGDVLTNGVAYDFARLEVNESEHCWFLFEPIRWRVSDYGVTKPPANWRTYASSDINFNVVSDTVLWLSAFSETSPKGEGYSVMSASINNIFDQMTFLNTSDYGTFSYLKKDSVAIDADSYSSETLTTKVANTTTALSGNSLRVASLAEIDENFSSFKAKASDLVATILGKSGYVNYWTRNLGQYYGNGNYVLKSGDKRNNGTYSNIMGVRFAMTMTEGGRY